MDMKSLFVFLKDRFTCITYIVDWKDIEFPFVQAWNCLFTLRTLNFNSSSLSADGGLILVLSMLVVFPM